MSKSFLREGKFSIIKNGEGNSEKNSPEKLSDEIIKKESGKI